MVSLEGGLISFQHSFHSLIHSLNYLLSTYVSGLLNLGDLDLSKASSFSHPYFQDYHRPSALVLLSHMPYKFDIGKLKNLLPVLNPTPQSI